MTIPMKKKPKFRWVITEFDLASHPPADADNVARSAVEAALGKGYDLLVGEDEAAAVLESRKPIEAHLAVHRGEVIHVKVLDETGEAAGPLGVRMTVRYRVRLADASVFDIDIHLAVRRMEKLDR